MTVFTRRSRLSLGSCAGAVHDQKAGTREAMADVAVVESICAGGGYVETFQL